nr:MAG TPA: hypothetical protein [Caudoviricetes sp.]
MRNAHRFRTVQKFTLLLYHGRIDRSMTAF